MTDVRTPEQKARKNARARERYANDPEYRRKIREGQASPRYKAVRRTRDNERYATDPEYRAKIRRLQAEYADDEQRREIAKKRTRAWGAAHRDYAIARLGAWQKENPEKVKEAKAKYKRNHRDRETELANQRRARVRSLPYEDIDRASVWERDAGVCHLCELPANPDKWHIDHIVPIARGGAHLYSNVAVSHPVCNMRKGARS